MTGDLKQRIVGIVVLVFLALIIIPWLFGHNQPPIFEEKQPHKADLSMTDLPEQVKEAPPGVQPIPGKSMNHRQTAPPPGSSIEVESIEEEAPVPSVHKPVDSSPKVAEINPSKLANIENTIVHSQSVAVRAVEAKIPQHKTNELQLRTPDFTKIKATKTSVSKLTSATVSNKMVTIQLGSFSQQANVTKLVQQLKAKGYPVYEKHSAGEKITRVFVGPIELQSAAENVQSIEKLTKVHGVIMKKNL